MAKASPEIIKAAEEYILAATHRRADFIEANGIHDEVSDFTCFHTTPNPPNRTLESFVGDMRRFQAQNLIANSFDFDSDGWVVGEVAWVISQMKGTFPDGFLIDVRVTTVLRCMEGQWRIAHMHLSEPVGGEQHMKPKV